jgi:hypothetical protein
MKSLQATAEEAVRDSLILEPKLPAVQLAPRLISTADPNFIGELSGQLLLNHFVRLIRAERAARAKDERKQILLPGFDHLPLRIAISKTKRSALRDATYTGVRSYCRMLGASHTDRRRGDPKLKEALNLRDLMRKYNRTRRGITVGEALALEAKKNAK